MLRSFTVIAEAIMAEVETYELYRIAPGFLHDPDEDTAIDLENKPTPTLKEVQELCHAWLAANHPDAQHVVLASWNEDGSGDSIFDVVGPPKDWHPRAAALESRKV